MDKRAQSSVGQVVVFSLISLFAIGILHFFMLEVATIANLEPILRQTIIDSPIQLDPATQQEIFDNYDRIIGFLRLMPFVLYFIIIAFMVIRIFRRERVEEYA